MNITDSDQGLGMDLTTTGGAITLKADLTFNVDMNAEADPRQVAEAAHALRYLADALESAYIKAGRVASDRVAN